MEKSKYIIPSIEVYHIQYAPLMANTLDTGDDDERGPQGSKDNEFDDDDIDKGFSWEWNDPFL